MGGFLIVVERARSLPLPVLTPHSEFRIPHSAITRPQTQAVLTSLWQYIDMSSFPVSENVAAMRSSSTLKAAQAATRLREQGIKVIDLSVGEPDFDTPEFVKQYAIEALESGLTKYTPVPGLTLFRNAIAGFYAERFGADISPSSVAAACGGKQGLFNAACTILNPGDELLRALHAFLRFRIG